MPFSNLSEFALRSILERFFETSFNAIVITTPDEGYKIVYANPEFCRMTGYAHDELIGNTPKILQGEKTNPKILQRLKACIDDGQAFHGATMNYRKDGTAYPVEWNISPVRDEYGKVTHFISIQKDLTQLKGIVTRLKNTSIHFSNFLMEITHITNDDSSLKVPQLASGMKKIITEELIDNSKLYNPGLRTDDNVDLFGEDEFFDCSNGLGGILNDGITQRKINAKDYCKELNSSIDTNELTHCINEVSNKLDYLSYSKNKEIDLNEIGQRINDMANEIFFFEDFVGISSALAELANKTSTLSKMDQLPIIIEIYQAVLTDLKSWINAVFINKNAEDIHEYDASIISSVRQLLMLLN